MRPTSHEGSCDPYGTRHYAVYFGLSVVQPKDARHLTHVGRVVHAS